jgi:hypothetical protein
MDLSYTVIARRNVTLSEAEGDVTTKQPFATTEKITYVTVS